MTLTIDKANNMTTTRKAVVIGATNGIGKACSHRLAGAGFNVIAVGRDTPGRAEAIIAELNAKSPANSSPSHEFRACNAFSLGVVKECAEGIVKDHQSIDALVMSQGMATTQHFTETVDGNDEKITLHYWSRMAFADRLLPSLRKSSMPGGPCVMSILSGGVHSPYKQFATDPLLKKSYSIINAANSAGFYNDLFLDSMAKREGNEHINFIHAAPGVVNSNWGTEFPWYLRFPVRCMQSIIAMDPGKCADKMCDPILKSTHETIARQNKDPSVFILNEDATEGKLTKEHTKEAMDTIWKVTAEILGKVGIDINAS
jgi:NAD(P)-dependent dehydrogenase (short-subunit alcohol dehydrogenase family)